MFQVEIYGRVQRAVLVEGRSRRAVAREFGISRKTIEKMLRYSVPPGYHYPTDEDLSVGTPLSAPAAGAAAQAGTVGGRDRRDSH